MLWHNRQQESAKCHWVSLHLLLLSAQKDKPVFHFLCILLVHLSFRKKKPSSFFCTALSESLWTCICDHSEGGQCAAGATDPGTLLPASTGTAETKDRSYSTVHFDQKLVVIDWPENPDLGFVAPREAGRQQMRGSSRQGTRLFGQKPAGTPTAYGRNSYLFYGVVYTS